MAPPTTYLGRQFAAYGDGWPAAAHADAMACRDLEERLAYGLLLFGFVMAKADAIRRRLAATGAAYDLPAAKEVEALLTQWLAPSAAAVAEIAAAEAKGFVVDRAGQFREAVDDARDFTSIPVERAAEESERIARQGLGRGSVSQAEMRRELRHRMGR